MFDPFLSCSAFWLPKDGAEQYIDLVRGWSGEKSLHTNADGSVEWGRQTKIKISGEQWYSAPPGIDFEARQALIPLGDLDVSGVGSLQVFAFVSAFSSVSSSFKTAAVRYAQRLTGDQGTTPELVLDLNGFAIDSWKHRTNQIRSVEGIDQFGLRVELTKARNEAFPEGMRHEPPRLDLHSITVEVLSRRGRAYRAKVYGDFNIDLDDVSVQFTEVASCVKATFEIFRDYLTASRLAIASLHV